MVAGVRQQSQKIGGLFGGLLIVADSSCARDRDGTSLLNRKLHAVAPIVVASINGSFRASSERTQPTSEGWLPDVRAAHFYFQFVTQEIITPDHDPVSSIIRLYQRTIHEGPTGLEAELTRLL